MDIRQLFTLSILGLGLMGCSTAQSAKTLDDTINQGANITLAESASTISNSLTNVGAIQRATTSPLSVKPLPDPNTYHMDGLASVDWSGPVGPLVQRIADISGYQLRVFGSTPSIPVLVTVNEKNMPLSYILRDIDYQAGNRANIVVFPERNIIELRYARS